MKNEFRKLLEEGDFKGLRRAWKELMPGMPQPKNLDEAEKTMHMARTASASIPLRLRAYSHSWLRERNLPSQLPEKFKPRAERMFPVVVEGVGVSVNFVSPHLQPAAEKVQTAMNLAIEEAFADGEKDPAVIKAKMMAAKDKEMKALFGSPR